MPASTATPAFKAATGAPLLALRGLRKAFGGVTAVSDVSLEVAAGQIYGLIGTNGAGKTTVFNIITGLYAADSGEVLFQGQAIARPRPHDMARLGIARTFQNIRLFANMSALENVMVGRHVRTQAGALGAILRASATRAEEAAIAARARELLEYTGIAAHGNTPAAQLSYGDQRRLEIARALATDPRLLALDEPAAGMNATETAALKTLLMRIRGDGVTLLLIEHDMKLVMGLCDRVAVMDSGRKIAEGAPAEVQRDPAVIAAYLGASVD